jgi:2-amino-4-hydroxy-6-hydroxymethyldihydropteridine diphosphokinase
VTDRATEVLLGLGANLGNPRATIESALVELEAAGVSLKARSAPYRTAPWGVTDQPDFINLCVLGFTRLTPEGLLDVIHRVETRLGRERRERWGPRNIDIDILLYGDATLDVPGLTIPHPRLTERAFVLVPLAEIAPERIVAGRSVRDWADAVDQTGVHRLES